MLIEELYTKINSQNSENIDILLEIADLTRDLLERKEYEKTCNLIKYVIRNKYYEMLAWILEIIQEKIVKLSKQSLEKFSCSLGKGIESYDELTENLDVNPRAIKNDIKKNYDKYGEVQSYFNILFYETKYKNIFLVSEENFDTKDNDFIQYRLLFIPEKERIIVKSKEDYEK